MQLTDAEKRMRDGEQGEPVRMAMEILMALGEIYGAERLIPVRSAHVAGLSLKSHGLAGTEWAEDLAAERRPRLHSHDHECGWRRSQPGLEAAGRVGEKPAAGSRRPTNAWGVSAHHPVFPIIAASFPDSGSISPGRNLPPSFLPIPFSAPETTGKAGRARLRRGSPAGPLCMVFIWTKTERAMSCSGCRRL